MHGARSSVHILIFYMESDIFLVLHMCWNHCVFLEQVDYAATGDQLSSHFSDCGTINRVTIMCNKATGQPKGFAYIEFQDHLAAQNALILNESTFLGRALKIVPKRTNVPAAYRGGYGRGRPRYTRGSRGYSRRPRRSWRGRWAPY